MPIILQITAWTILAVGLLALGHKFFPKFKQWFTTGKVSYVWVIAITLGLFVLLTYPYFFNWWAVNFWNVPEGELTDLTKLGPLGDIYGSLNTIFTSATLAFVVYATFLQRQANIDARIAMDKQLQQSQKATAAQLREARRSTKEQLIQAKYALRVQLKQAEESTKQQLALAQANHDAQIQESKNSFFISQFYALLNYKNEKLNGLILTDTNGKFLKGQDIFRWFDIELCVNLGKKYYNDLDNLDIQKIEQEFISITKKYNNNQTYYEIFSYFEIYSSLIKLLQSVNIENKAFYWELIRGSMTGYEQCCLFYLAPMWERVYLPLQKCRIFNAFVVDDTTSGFALKFYSKENFATKDWQIFFTEQDM